LDGCIGNPEIFSITTVDPIPVVLNPGDQLWCAGDMTNDVIFMGPNPITSFIWTNDNTSIGIPANGTGNINSFPIDNSSFSIQDAIITVTPEFNGCFGNPETFVLSVKPVPNVFVTPEIQEHCSGE
jgi:hypothetical protein